MKDLKYVFGMHKQFPQFFHTDVVDVVCTDDATEDKCRYTN